MKSYRSYKRGICQILLGITLLLGLTSSDKITAGAMAKFGRQIEVVEIEKVEMKGFTGLQVILLVENRSKLDISLSNAAATLLIGSQPIGRLEQVEPAISHSSKRESIPTLWKFVDIDPMSLLALGSKIAQSDYSDITVDYSAVLSADKISIEVADKGVKVDKFIGKLLTK